MITIERETLEDAYRQGWRAAASWANRDDLLSDINSSAYENERDARLRNLRAALAAQPADASMDTTLRNAARRSATIVDRGRMVKPVEPVAYIWGRDQLRWNAPDDSRIAHQPLYAAPPAPAAVPLTVSEIERMWSDAIMNGADGAILFARAIERAHGIAAGDKS